MSSVAISALVFACVFAGALLGISLRSVLPEHHRNVESKDLVRSAMGLIGTISALVLGLLVASAKGAFDTQKSELTALCADAVLLDRVLAHYGPEARQARELLRGNVADAQRVFWGAGGTVETRGDALYDQVAALSPKDENQRALQAEASGLIIEMGKTRNLMFAQRESSISMPLLVVVVFWLTVNFVSFGLFAHRNATVAAALLVCALSVAGAIFLILEMDRPFEGVIQISSEPVRRALDSLGR